MDNIQKEIDNNNRFMKSYVRKCEEIGLNDEWKLIALRFVIYRGHMSDIDVHLRRVKQCQDRNNTLIKMDLSGDRKSAYRDDSSYTYSGIGKTCGIETLAKLSAKATDEEIVKFYESSKGKNKIKMVDIKKELSHVFS